MSSTARRYPGRFIVIEGIDGCGSTTQSRRLVEGLRARGRDARHTFEPSDGPIGALLRHILTGELEAPDGRRPRSVRWSALALLFSADRLDHLDSFVIPALSAGAAVVSDRYDLSSLAYQSVTAPTGTDPVAWIRELNRDALRPDLTVVLDVPPGEAELRRRARGQAEELFEKRAIQERLAEVYARAETLVPADPLVHLSGSGEVSAIAERLLAAVLAACPELA